MTRRPAALLLLAVSLGGCAPYATLPRGFQAGQPIGQRVGICYNTLRSSPAQTQAEAQGECAPNTVAEPVDSDWYMETCPLLLPTRATFVCVAKK